MARERGLTTPLPASVAREVELRANVLDQIREALVGLGVARTLEQIDPNAPLFVGGLEIDPAALDAKLDEIYGISLLDGGLIPRTVGGVVDLVIQRMRARTQDEVPTRRPPRGEDA